MVLRTQILFCYFYIVSNIISNIVSEHACSTLLNEHVHAHIYALDCAHLTSTESWKYINAMVIKAVTISRMMNTMKRML